MKIPIRVCAQAGKNLVREEDGLLKVYVTAPALDGRANDAVVELLAEYYGVRRSQVEIIKGLKSKNKLINISA